MPNHVRNVLKFNSLKPEEVDFIVSLLSTEVKDEEYCIDFDKIIPEPRIESDCPEDCKVNKDSHVEEDLERPWFDWYKWRNKYWDTKWNAYDGYIKLGKSYVMFVFSTAWSMPLPIYKRLKLLGYNFEVRYADEDIGNNCGKLIYNPDKTGFSDLVHISEEDLDDPERFARRIWDTY